jgi:hypothetical protein
LRAWPDETQVDQILIKNKCMGRAVYDNQHFSLTTITLRAEHNVKKLLTDIIHQCS